MPLPHGPKYETSFGTPLKISVGPFTFLLLSVLACKSSPVSSNSDTNSFSFPVRPLIFRVPMLHPFLFFSFCWSYFLFQFIFNFFAIFLFCAVVLFLALSDFNLVFSFQYPIPLSFFVPKPFYLLYL